MPLFFGGLIHQGPAFFHNDDILLMSNSKSHALQLIKQLYDIANKEILKPIPQKYVFMLLSVKYICHDIGFDIIKAVQSKIAAIHKFFLRLQF